MHTTTIRKDAEAAHAHAHMFGACLLTNTQYAKELKEEEKASRACETLKEKAMGERST